MAQSRQEIYKKYNSQNPVLSVRTKNKDRFFELCKKMDLTAEQLFNSLFETFQKNYVPVSNRVSKAASNFEQLRQYLASYVAAGGSVQTILDVLEEIELGQNMRNETQQEELEMNKQKLTKEQTESKRGEVLDICRKALTNPSLGVSEARQAAELFLAIGGNPAELAQLAKGEFSAPAEAVSKTEAKADPGEKARKIKEEMLGQSELQQHAHLFKARGWL